MTKSLANKICLKEHLYMLSRVECTPIQNHLDDFNFTIFNLECPNVKIEDEDKPILSVVPLPASDKHFKEILLYGNNGTLSFEDVKANLLSKEIFSLQVRAEKGEGLLVKGESF